MINFTFDFFFLCYLDSYKQVVETYKKIRLKN